MPRYPKPGGEMHSRRRLEYGWTVLPAAGRAGEPPALPRTAPGGREWTDDARDAWARAWASPQATQWDEDDPSMRVWVGIVDRWARGEARVGELTEKRQIEDRHGLNPKAMLQLRWRIAEAEEAAPEPAPVARPGTVRAPHRRGVTVAVGYASRATA